MGRVGEEKQTESSSDGLELEIRARPLSSLSIKEVSQARAFADVRHIFLGRADHSNLLKE
jgi:hypothetical protein